MLYIQLTQATNLSVLQHLPIVYPFTRINNYTIDIWKAIQSRSFFLLQKVKKLAIFQKMLKKLMK